MGLELITAFALIGTALIIIADILWQNRPPKLRGNDYAETDTEPGNNKRPQL